MTAFRAYRYGWLLPVVLTCSLACSKVSVEIPTTVQTSDPDVTYLDAYTVQVQTQQLDSFTTGGRSSFLAGNHSDPWFGHVEAESYAQLTLPTSNPVKDQTVFLDSICLRLRTNGQPYGDTTTGLTLQAFRVTDPIATYDGNAGSFYNTQRFSHESAPIGARSMVLRPTLDTLISLRLSDALGQEWLDKLRRNDEEMQSQAAFIDYFRGLCIRADTNTTKALYYFTSSRAGGLVRLYYHVNSAVPSQAYLDFGYTTAMQFSHIDIRHDGSPLSVFTPGKRELRGSEEMGGRGYLDATMGKYIKLSFPTILNLKELHPYVQVIRAQLEIAPTAGSYASPYSLPSTMNLFQTDNYSDLGPTIKNPGTVVAQTGALYVDALYGKDTKYTYDITSFIQSIVATGEFANKSLMMVPGSYAGFDAYKRIVINDQSLANGVKLKLYVLGL